MLRSPPVQLHPTPPERCR